MKISIRSKIILTFTALMAIVLVAQLIFNSFFAESFYTQHKQDIIAGASDVIKEQFNGDYESFELLVESYESQHSINITVIYNNELFYTTTNRMLQLPQNFKYDYDVSSILSETSQSGRPTPPPEKNDLDFRESFEFDGKEVIIMLNVHAEAISESVSVFSNASLMITLAVFIIGFIVCLLISNSITKPIRATLAVTNKLAKLDFSDSVNEKISSTELAGLAVGINEMSQKLEVATNELYSANEKLKADIDYQKKIENMRREFIANVSHEMKTPLALMQIYAENLKSDLPGIDKDYYYDTIIEESQSLSSMLSSLLDISSIENGLMTMNLREGSLSNVCKNFVQKLAPILEDFNVYYEIEDDVEAVFDEKYIEMAMRNYIVNATEHTKKGGTIKITLDKNRRFAVYNEGSYISEEDYERIWESFYRADKSHKRGNKNVGLGLSIVRAVIEGHGGKYSLQNINDGVIFSFEV